MCTGFCKGDTQFYLLWCYTLEIPIDCHIKLLAPLGEQILIYGSETYGFGKPNAFERAHLQKNLLKLKQSTPDYMVYGELSI